MDIKEVLDLMEQDGCFFEETQEEFDQRMVEYKKKVEELDKKLPLKVRNFLFSLDHELKEVPTLMKFVDKYYEDTTKEFEKRLERFKNGKKVG